MPAVVVAVVMWESASSISKGCGKILSCWSSIFGGAGLDFQGMRGLSL